MPAQFVRQLRLTRNVMVIVGLVFLSVGTILGITFTAVALGGGPGVFAILGPVFLLIFGGLGATLARLGNKKALAVLRALEQGAATRGEIAAVYLDTTIRINGRSPWALEYRFEVGNRVHEGKAQTWDHTARERQPGQPLHVLYVEDDPEQNTIWPPVK